MKLVGSSRLTVQGLLRSKPYTTAARATLEKQKEDLIPPAQVKWYYATDVPLSKPAWFEYTKTEEAKKFLPFSDYDSRRVERRYREYRDEARLGARQGSGAGRGQTDQGQVEGQVQNDGLDGPDGLVQPLVDVNEDRLFQVNVRDFSLAPVYWDGPVYEVRRGVWFTTDGLPLSGGLTRRVEEGYRERKPFIPDGRSPEGMDGASASTSSAGASASEESSSTRAGASASSGPDPSGLRPAVSAAPAVSKADIAKFNSNELGDTIDLNLPENDDLLLIDSTAILFLNSTQAVMFPQSMVNSFQLPIIRKFGASSAPLIHVTHIQRGFTSDLTASIFDSITETSIPDLSDIFQQETANLFQEPAKKSTNYSDENDGKEGKQNSEMKHMIEDDFEKDTTKETSKRHVDHLVLCIHGIGQVLGSKYESINFAHNINTLRNTMKTVYKNNPKFKKMAYKDEALDGDQSEFNHKVQVLPIAWRHRVDFHPNKLPEEEQEKVEPRLPTLSQINVDGVRSLRNVIGDVALDILLYYEAKYYTQILSSVTEEINRVYTLYKERNPEFNGKVHLLGHSLGSAIAFDIASFQENTLAETPDPSVDLLFDIDGLFCIGCPVGVFKLLGQKNIVNREDLDPEFNPRTGEYDFSSPKCNNLYNLYHPCDPIGYRLEPLIKPRFAHFKAEEAPFAVEGLSSQIKGLTAFTDDIQDRFSKATNWFMKKKSSKASEENALGEIVSSIVKSEEKDVKVKSKASMPQEDLAVLTKFNRSARVDYCLPMGVFDISLVSAISAHVSYFEDKDTAGFVMGELLTYEKEVTKMKQVLYKETD